MAHFGRLYPNPPERVKLSARTMFNKRNRKEITLGLRVYLNTILGTQGCQVAQVRFECEKYVSLVLEWNELDLWT